MPSKDLWIRDDDFARHFLILLLFSQEEATANVGSLESRYFRDPDRVQLAHPQSAKHQLQLRGVAESDECERIVASLPAEESGEGEPGEPRVAPASEPS